MRDEKYPLTLYFSLIFALSAPIWFLGSTTQWQFLPGVPLSALTVVCPSTAALVCAYRYRRLEGLRELATRCTDAKKLRPVWLALILLLIPATSVIAYWTMRELHIEVPKPELDWLSAPLLFVFLLLCALSEELGWSGFAIDRLQHRSSALLAGMILGAVWALWHLIPLQQANRGIEWIAWWSLGTVALRVLHTWLYNNTAGSVFGAALFHASNNLSWQMFPNRGSHFDPKINALLLTFVVVIVVLFFGPKTLARRH